jgi:type IV pilus assembly protein PilM
LSIQSERMRRERLTTKSMQLTRSKKNATVAGLEIEAGSVAAAEVTVNGIARVGAGGVEALPPGAFHEGEVIDAEALSDTLKTLFSRHKLPKRVRLGIANQGVVVRTVRLPAIEDPKELDAAVRFQAQEQIPMPLDQAVLEHQVVGGVPAEEGATPRIDVVVVAARREMVSGFVEAMRRAGLDPAGIDLSAFGMIRALADTVRAGEQEQQREAPQAAGVLYCSAGDVANLAVARGRACLFTRVSSAGLAPIWARLGSSLGLSQEHAMQWLTHVGLDAPLESVEGDAPSVAEVRAALDAGASDLVDEMRLSLDYYRAQEASVPIEQAVLCGPGSLIPGFAARMEAGLGLPIAPLRPSALEAFDAISAARLTLPFGLALEQ